MREPARRTGPHPLPLHLAMAMGGWTSSLAALPFAKSDSLPWRPDLKETAEDLVAACRDVDPEVLTAAVATEAGERLHDMLAGITAYWAHPYRRPAGAERVLWESGSTRLLDCGADEQSPPVLLVPSLINRAYILDLLPERSLIGYLRERGFRPLLLDWGAPGNSERDFDLDAYVTERLEGALSIAAAGGRPVPLIGYCMGGLLALAAARRHPETVARLVLLATPWDFHTDHRWLAPLIAAAEPAFDTLLHAQGAMPVELLQAGFAMLNPTLVPEKFRSFAKVAAASDEARTFVAVEDWLNDGVPLTAPVARDCILGWYRDNLPGRGAWRVAGQPIIAEEIATPALVVIPAQDRIVPPASAAALADALPHAVRMEPPCGHISMVASPRAPDRVWARLASWLSSKV